MLDEIVKLYTSCMRSRVQVVALRGNSLVKLDLDSKFRL